MKWAEVSDIEMFVYEKWFCNYLLYLLFLKHLEPYYLQCSSDGKGKTGDQFKEVRFSTAESLSMTFSVSLIRQRDKGNFWLRVLNIYNNIHHNSVLGESKASNFSDK